MQPKCWCNIFNAWMCTETLFLFHGDNQTVWRTFTGIHGTSLMIQDWIISICAYVCVFHVYVILSACTCDLWVLCFVFYGLLSVLYLHILLLVPKWQIIVVFILFLLALNPNFVRKSQKEVKENGYICTQPYILIHIYILHTCEHWGFQLIPYPREPEWDNIDAVKL